MDQPRNALSMTSWGVSRCTSPPQEKHTPTRSAPNRNIDPPSPRLLAIHRAVSHILHLSAAGEYMDKILADMEDSLVRADGSAELGRLVQLGLFGWTQST